MKQADKQGSNNTTGALGEQVAAKKLMQMGLRVDEVNYLKKWGEIDIVAHGTDKIHFVEVKTVSYETKTKLYWAISHETWRPEENLHQKKLNRLGRTITSWILEHNYTGKWQLDAVLVRIVPREKYATVNILPNIII